MYADPRLNKTHWHVDLVGVTVVVAIVCYTVTEVIVI